LLPADDIGRQKLEADILGKCYDVGLIREGKRLSEIEDVGVARFCRRRLSERLVVLRMADSPKDATRFIEQGHVRVGPDTVTDPAFLVSRNMEDFVTWADSSKIKRSIQTYKNKVDDFELLGE
jgi:U3 small nucleolar ribonucleoprotein protein IMP3